VTRDDDGKVSSVRYEAVNAMLLNEGESKDGMVKFTFGRPAKMHGVTLGNSMGVNTWAAFAGSDDNAKPWTELHEKHFAGLTDMEMIVLKGTS
jgi:hypothetical protein